MRLKQAATYNLKTEFEILDANDAWVDGFFGDFAPIDRFLSNFHRPMQRRMLHSHPDEDLPASRVIRNKVTGEVYLLGQTRKDDDGTETYAKITVAHMTYNGSSGLAVVTRKIPDNGRPAATIGELIDSTVGNYYVSVEYRTSLENSGNDSLYDDRFILFAPEPLNIQADDIIELLGETYTVNSPYKDSEFTCALMIREPEDRVTGTYRRKTDTYSTVTGVVTKAYDDYLVTCTVNKLEGQLKLGEKYGVDSEIEIYLKSSSFPIEPKIGNLFVASGETFIIRGISQDKEAGDQWRLYCARSN